MAGRHPNTNATVHSTIDNRGTHALLAMRRTLSVSLFFFFCPLQGMDVIHTQIPIFWGKILYKGVPSQRRNRGQAAHPHHRHQRIPKPRRHIPKPAQNVNRNDCITCIGDCRKGDQAVCQWHHGDIAGAGSHKRIPPRRKRLARGDQIDDAGGIGHVAADEQSPYGVAMAALQGDAEDGDADGGLGEAD